MKTCTKCLVAQPLESFSKDARLKDGRGNQCSTCGKASCKARYEQRKDEYKAAAKKWREANPEKRRESNRVSAQKRYQADLEKHRAYHANWRAENLDKTRAVQRLSKTKSRNAAPEEARAYARSWASSNRDKVRVCEARRRAAKRNAVSSWDAELDTLVEIEAQHLRLLRDKITGFTWHVDHVVALAAKNACGLHNAYNLAVVPAAYNCSKKNKLDDARLNPWVWIWR